MSHAFLGRKAYPIASQTGSQGTEFHVTAPNRTDAYFVLVKETKEEGGTRESLKLAVSLSGCKWHSARLLLRQQTELQTVTSTGPVD